jgi:hypothetical protein
MGKASNYISDGSEANNIKMRNAELSAQNRQGISNVSIDASGAPTKGLAALDDKSKLAKIGGQMVGSIGFKSNRTIIVSGTASIDDELGTDTIGKTLIKIIGETTGGDTIDNLTGRKYEGQMVVLMNNSSAVADTITFTHGGGADGQFLCPGSADYVLGAYESVLLFHDTQFATSTWRLITQPVSAGGSGVEEGDSPTWTGSHTWNGTTQIFNGTGFQVAATTIVIGDSSSDNLTINAKLQTALLPDGNSINLGDSSNKFKYVYLNSGLGTSRIYLDGGGDTYITGSGTSGSINIYNDGSNNTTFSTAGIVTTQLETFGDIDLNSTGDIVNLDQILFASSSATLSGAGISSVTGDVYYNAATNDDHFFRVNNVTSLDISDHDIDVRGGIPLKFRESSSDPTANSAAALLFSKDNGAGKTALYVLFPTGFKIQIAVEA